MIILGPRRIPSIKISIRISFLLVILTGISGFTQAAENLSGPGWTTYENGLVGWKIEYPSHILHALPQTENNTMRVFQSEDGATQLVAYGGASDFDSVAAYRDQIIRFGRSSELYREVTYAPMHKSWFVLSGYRGGNIYYEKYVFSGDRSLVQAFLFEYPASQSAMYNDIAARMSKSFVYQKSAP